MGIVCPDESKRIEIEEFRRMLLSNAAVHRTKAGDEIQNPGQLPATNRHNRELEEKKVCVTSGVSFLGIAIVSQLLLRGYSVRVIVEKQEDLEKLREMEISGEMRQSMNTVEAVMARLNDIESLSQAFSGCRGVFHTAAFVDPAGLSGYSKSMVEVEALVTKNVSQACAITPSVKFFFFKLLTMAATQAELSKTAGKPIHCRAAVARKAGEPLVIEEVIVAPPKACEVRIKIVCTSLCHSDVTFWKLKDFPGCFPRILGHEAFGIVESVGENVQDLKEGDSVIPIFLPDCAECIDCTSKKSNSCSQFQFKVSPWMLRDGTSRFTTVDGETLYHFLSVSSFAEYTVVDIANVTKIDPRVPPNRACLFSCGVSTGVGAALKTANVEQGSTVVIFGLGGIGLAVAEGARICGASRIIGVDINTDKFEIGKQFGVTDFVDSNSYGDKPISQVINEMTNGGADYCFECVGMGTLVEEAYACCRKGWGKTIVVGVDKPGAMLTFKSFDILHLGKTIMGSLFGGLKPKSDIPLLVKRYLDKELELDKFVTHEVSFQHINTAFDLLVEGKSLRCVIWMDK